MIRKILIVLSSLIVAVGRFMVPGHQISLAGSYEAFSHIWIGYLFGVLIYSEEKRKMVFWLLLGLSAIEAFKFFTK